MYKSVTARVVSGAMLAVWLTLPLAAAADTLDVRISETIPYVTIEYEGKKVRVMRIQDENHTLTGGFAKTSRKCPPFCFQPAEIAPKVSTVGEVEVAEFMRSEYTRKSGLIIDSRIPSWFEKGTIPGAVNVPFTIFDKETGDPQQLAEAMALFGVKPRTGEEERSFWDKLFGSDDSSRSSEWDFSRAKELLMFCNGAWCEQSPTAIRALLKLGYPAEKIHWYRGGMQMWQLGGFTTVVPGAVE